MPEFQERRHAEADRPCPQDQDRAIARELLAPHSVQRDGKRVGEYGGRRVEAGGQRFAL
jgi:hypothetical protein